MKHAIEMTEQSLTENTMEIDLQNLKTTAQKSEENSAESISEQDDEDIDTTWLFESTVTNMPAYESTITNVKALIEKEQSAAVKTKSSEPAWRVLEKRREARELKELLGDDFMDLALEDAVQ